MYPWSSQFIIQHKVYDFIHFFVIEISHNKSNRIANTFYLILFNGQLPNDTKSNSV